MSEALQDLSDHIIQQVNSRPDGPRLVGFQWHLDWGDHVSNTHSAPRGEPTNFQGNPDLPRCYPGWHGRVWVRYDKEGLGFGSDCLRGAGLHTGTGGLGCYNGPWDAFYKLVYRHREYFSRKEYDTLEPKIFSWDCRVWADDFPEIRKAFLIEQSLDILADSAATSHKYLWQDPHQVEQDDHLMQRIKQFCIENPDKIHSYT